MQNIDTFNEVPVQGQYPLKLCAFDAADNDNIDDYSPAVTVQNFSSRGQMHRIAGRTNNRLHELMSKLEYMTLILLEMNPYIIDIKTQFPHDLNDSIELASRLGINHPPQNDAQKTQLTTDFVITIAGNPERQVGIYVKYVKELNKYRTIEKLALERQSLALINIPLYVVTEKEISPLLMRSLEWLLLAKLDVLEVQLTSDYALQFYNQLQQNSVKKLALFLHQLDGDRCMPEGSHLFRFKCLAQLNYLRFDLYSDPYGLCCGDISFNGEASVL